MYLNVYGTLNVKAQELVDDLEENGYISLDEEIEQSTGKVLSDSIGIISLNEMEDFENYSENDSIESDISENEENMSSDDKFRIMIVFCFGLCAGVIVGHFLTGFIK